MRDTRRIWVGLALCFGLSGCGGDDPAPSEPFVVPEGCNPVGWPHDCLLPFPSDVLIEDGQVSLNDATRIVTESGGLVEPFTLHPSDGFSPGTQILALFPEGVDDAPLVGAVDDPLSSLDADSPTVLLDAATGERVMHLSEIDPRAQSDDRRALVIRPLVRLTDGARYIVAIHGLQDRDGQPIDPPEGFAHLRDGTASGSLEVLAQRYDDDVFTPLDAAGVARESLQLAWDFTVRSADDATRDMLRVRDLTLDALVAAPPVAEVVSVEDAPDEHTFRRIEMRVAVPLFTERDEPLSLIHRGDDGQVTANGEVDVAFTVWVPNSVANRQAGDPPARLMQFGHGFFGERSEVDSFIVELADERQLVVVATNWEGMSAPDRIAVAESLNGDLSQAMAFTDRVHQAMANFMAVAHVAQNGLVDLPELAIGPTPIFDASTLYYYGISLGGILGGTYLALSPYPDRGVLSVCGADFSFMMFRARPFLAFLLVVGFQIPDFLDQQKFVALAQTSLDRIDPLSYAPQVEMPVLMQIGIGDDSVPNLVSHLHARALGLEHLTPAPRVIAGLASSDGPTERAIVEFDFGIDPLPGELALPPTSETEAHEGVRRLAAAKEQLHRFFAPGGMIEHTCDGACDPE